MAELPTKLQLEQLYKDKGPDALVWYAWRNALRITPLLGDLNIQQIWKENTIKYIFSVYHPLLILAQWTRTPSRITEHYYSIFKVAAAALEAADDANAYVGDDQIITNFIAPVATFAAKSAVIAADTAACAYNTSYYAQVCDSFSTAEANADADVHDVAEVLVNYFSDAHCMQGAEEIMYIGGAADAFNSIIRAAAIDFTKLNKQETRVGDSFWCSVPLWPEELNLERPEYKYLSECWERHFEDLNSMGLDFLALDLKTIIEGKRLPLHAENYLETLSDTIVNDADRLSEAILYGQESLQKLSAVRVLLLGSGGAGKTSLSARLQGIRSTKNQHAATLGMESVQLKQADLQASHSWLECEDKDLELHVWDFGGQSIFYGLHRAFLHENCVYVLVVDSRHEQAPDEWLQQIRDLSKSPPKVLLVTNLYEGCDTDQNEKRLLREFPSLLHSSGQFYYFSCHNPTEGKAYTQEFQSFLQSLIKEAIKSRYAVMKSTMDVQCRMSQKFENRVLIDQEELEGLMPKSASMKVCSDIEEDLKQLGYMIPIDSDGLTHCLKPDWVLDNAYCVIRPGALKQAGGDSGVASVKQIRRILKSDIKTSEVKHLLDLLRSRGICQRLDNAEGGYFFPDSAPADEPEVAGNILAKHAEVLRIHFDLPYLPLGFHAQLVNSLFRPDNDASIRSITDIWRQGFILRYGESCAVVHYLYRKHLIEVVLSGKLEDFSVLLKTLLIPMERELTRGYWMQEKHINPSVVLNEQLFSVHSAEDLVKVLGTIRSYDKLLETVQSMASKKIEVNVGNNSNVAIDAHDINQHSSNTTKTTDQRQVMGVVLEEIFERRSDLSKQQIRQVLDLQDLLEGKKERSTPAEQTKLKAAWEELKSTTGAVNDGIGVATAVSQNWPAITAWLTALAATM